jgi:predicted PurR-regulated permease PerM
MTFKGIQQLFFFGLLLGTSSVFLWMLGSYLLPIFWATVIAIIFYPLYEWFVVHLWQRKTLASLVTIVAVIFAVVLPLALVATLVTQESISIYQSLTTNGAGERFGLIERASTAIAYVEPLELTAAEVEERVRGELATAAERLAASTLAVGQSTLTFGVYVAVTVYLLFFLFRDGRYLVDKLAHYLPLGPGYEHRLFARFTETTRAVVQGTLTVAIIQGTLGGITLWIAGVPAPALWGLVMTLLGIIPAVGTPIVWFPAAVMLLLAGEIWQGVMVVVVGALLVSSIDNFLRPVLVGRKAKLPDAVVLLATLGGIASFGISGFVVGPIMAAFFISLWMMFEEKYRAQLKRK